MAEEQDKTHRLLLQFPRLVRDLVRLYLGGEWLERLDFSTLEPVSERLLSPELVRREEDALWRVVYYPEGRPVVDESEETEPRASLYLEQDAEILSEEVCFLYIYIHIEHQSRPRRFMALDMLSYKLLALQAIVRQGLKGGERLPNLLSVVFYNGDAPWNESTSLLDLIEPADGLPGDLDFWNYRLIDAQRLDLEDLVGSDSPLLGLFQLEQLGSIRDLEKATRSLRETLKPEEVELRDAFITFINEAVLPKLTPPDEKPPRISDIEEVPTMVAQRIERITQGWMEEGEQRGLQKGRLAMLQRQLELKFGNLSSDVTKRLEQADVERLELWGDRVLVAETLEEVLRD